MKEDHSRRLPSLDGRSDARPDIVPHFKIHGMDCAEDVAVLKRELGPLVGGEEYLAFDILNGKMIVSPGPKPLPPDTILQAVARTGMRADVWQDERAPALAEGFWQRRGRMVLTAASGLLGLAGFLVHAWTAGGVMAAVGSEGLGQSHHVPLAAQVLYALGIGTGAWYIVPKAWFAARRLRPDMNLLMTIAVMGAVGIGEWFEAATVSFLFALSLALESWSVGRARRAVAALLDLAPPTVRLQREDGSEHEVPLDQVSVGSLFVVRPGEKIALDGRVTRGASEVNQAPITGESVPVPKSAGNQVFAGTINGDGALDVTWVHLPN